MTIQTNHLAEFGREVKGTCPVSPLAQQRAPVDDPKVQTMPPELYSEHVKFFADIKLYAPRAWGITCANTIAPTVAFFGYSTGRLQVAARPITKCHGKRGAAPGG